MWAFSIRLTKAECLIVRLSLLEDMKPSDIMAPSRWDGGGRTMSPEPGLGVLERIEGRFLGVVGAMIEDCNRKTRSFNEFVLLV